MLLECGRYGAGGTFVGVLDVLGLAAALLDDPPPLSGLALLLLLQLLSGLLTQQQLETEQCRQEPSSTR